MIAPDRHMQGSRGVRAVLSIGRRPPASNRAAAVAQPRAAAKCSAVLPSWSTPAGSVLALCPPSLSNVSLQFTPSVLLSL